MPTTDLKPPPATDAATRIGNLFQALGDPTRVRILNLLAAGELCVCDLVELLDQPQPTVSRHLATLRNAELVDARRVGRFAHYRLVEDGAELRARLAETVRDGFRRLPGLDTERQAAERRARARTEEPCP